MSAPDSHSPGFSRGRRWLTTVNLLAATAALLALLVMVNYLAQGHFRRWQLADYTNYKLSPQTLRILHDLTNDVKVTIFYDRSDGGDVYLMIAGLLAEYQNASPHIHVKALDYVTDPGEASLLREKLHLTGTDQKDFVLIESNGHHKICYGRELSIYDFNEVLSGRSRNVRRTDFLGEAKFTAAIFAVSYPQEMKAYFLSGHGELDPGDPTDKPKSDGTGVSKLAAILKDEMDCDWRVLRLSETNGVPEDCKLLIIATPRENVAKLSSNECDQIQTYLKKHNGRLLALLDNTEGLDSNLGDPWGVVVAPASVIEMDKKFQIQPLGYDFMASPAMDTNQPIHAVVKALAKERMQVRMVLPRPIYHTGPASPAPGAPTLSPLLATSTNAYLVTNSASGLGLDRREHGSFPLAVAVEQGGIIAGDGTRIILAGDSEFLRDDIIDSVAANHYFANLALSWLLHRNEIAIEGVGPLPIKEYRLMMTEWQTRQLEWLFLGAMPGAVLFLGALVWLRRRS